MKSQFIIQNSNFAYPPLKSATLIYNPIAGRRPRRRERQIEQAAAALRAGGLAVEVARTSGPGTAQGLARAAVAGGKDLVIVCGGDGTVNEVINGVAPGKITLAILPGGTANIVARELRLPQDPVRAARQLPQWSARRIALGLATCSIGPSAPGSEVVRRYFLSVAGIGFDAYIVHRLSLAFKMSFGVVAYGWEALRQVMRYSFPPFVCRVDGRELCGTFAVIHRTRRYAGWLHLAPSANLFEARVSLCLFKGRHRARYFFYAAAAAVRQHLRLRDVELIQGREVVCATAESGQPIYFELDGEFAGKLPTTFEVVPDALTLLVPEGRGRNSKLEIRN